jgi:hypothetical protein
MGSYEKLSKFFQLDDYIVVYSLILPKLMDEFEIEIFVLVFRLTKVQIYGID